MSTLDLHDLARDAARARLADLVVEPALAASAIGTWRARMVNEHGSARVFEGLADQMEDAGIDAATVAEVRGFAAEERRHGMLCGAAVVALGGRALAPALPAAEFPWHADAGSKLEAVLRNVLSVSCLSETVAVALIGKEREEMPESPLRKVLSEIWADEVGHARFGWRFVGAHVPTLDAAAKRRLGDYLEVALEHLEEHELAHLPEGIPVPAGGECYGLCSGSEARALFYDTVRTVIVPTLEKLGLAVPAAGVARTRH